MAGDWLHEVMGQPHGAASPFGGRLLTADDLTREQGAAGRSGFKEFTVTKKTDTASGLADFDALVDAVAVLPWSPDDPLL